MHWRWRWWDWIQTIFLNLFYFTPVLYKTAYFTNLLKFQIGAEILVFQMWEWWFYEIFVAFHKCLYLYSKIVPNIKTQQPNTCNPTKHLLLSWNQHGEICEGIHVGEYIWGNACEGILSMKTSQPKSCHPTKYLLLSWNQYGETCEGIHQGYEKHLHN